MGEIKGNVQAAVEAVERLKLGDVEVVVASDGRQVPILLHPGGLATSLQKLLDEGRTAPERRKGTACLGDLASFVAWVLRQKDASSVLFADPGPNGRAPKLTAVVDYHGLDGSPRFGQHRGVYPFELAPEWTAWGEKDKEPMRQDGFAAWLENHGEDVLDPAKVDLGPDTILGGWLRQNNVSAFADPGDLLLLSRGLEVRSEQKVASFSKLASGEGRVTFETTNTAMDGTPLRVPGAFLLALRVFRNGEVYQVPTRLRYRAAGGAISFWYELARVDRVFDDAFAAACATASEKTGLPLFVGSPEV